MFDYEFGQANYDIDVIKDELRAYLKSCKYPDNEEPIAAAERTFKYLEEVVDLIIKRRDYSIKFGAGGSPLWHSEVLTFVAKWIEAENKAITILTKKFDGELPGCGEQS